MATILGLLLVVTFIANYISTTLPNTMGQNDLQHDVTVQNQVAQLSALLQVTAASGAVGAPVSQAVTLGSAGAPPFASADSSVISPIANGSGVSVNFALVGPLRLPSGGTPNFGTLGGKCTPTLPPPPKAVVCTGSTSMNWNFSAGNNASYWVNGTGGLSAQVNFTTNNSFISVGQVGGANNVVGVFGNGNTITITAKGGASLVLLLVGNNNSVSMSANGGATFTILVIGNYDTVSTSAKGSSTIVASFYGGHDSYTDTSTSTVYFTGYNIQNANSGLCPYGNIADTNTVGGTGGGTVYYNDTNSNGTGSHAPGWTYIVTNPPKSGCPYVVTAVESQNGSGTGFVVSLRNTYVSRAEVAFDQGAVVFAQPGGLPVFIVPPPISYTHQVLSLFVPIFVNKVATEAGVGTADLALRLLSAPSLVLPGNQFNLGNNSYVTVQVVTPYAAAWYAYFQSVSTLAPYVTCTGGHNVCSALYYPGGPLGTVTLAIPTAGLSLNFMVAYYSLAIE